MSNRLDQEREKRLTPIRYKKACSALLARGYLVELESDICISIIYKGHKVLYYPYSGWHTGKSINDGRGFKRLLKQINEKG